ncbi:MAG: ATP-binding protein [Clostridia bacterium]|nr:ATP-binding protein [Clostridia bacterium]
MRREILDQLRSEYEAQRRENDRLFFARRAEVEQKSPEIGRLMDGRQQLIFSSIRSMISGQHTGDVEEQMAEMNRKIRTGLQEIGYSPDYLEPQYRCPICQDTGYVGDPVREMCQCMQRELSRRLCREAGLSGQEEQSYETFDLSVFPDTQIPQLGMTQREEMDYIRDRTLQWVQHYPDVREASGVLLCGASGLGKTFLLHCMAKVLLDRGMQVMIFSSFKAQDIMRKAYFSRDGQSDMDMLLDCDVLLIDDFGTEPLLDNVTVTQFFNLINERQTRRKACIFSTNLTPKNLRDRYTERIASRMLDARSMLLIELRGEDVRRRA